MRMNGDQKGRARKMVAVLQVWERPPFLARYARALGASTKSIQGRELQGLKL